MFQADPEHKKKGYDSKYQKGKKGDADKSGVRKNRSKRDFRSRDLSYSELRERRRAHSPDRKSNKSRPNTPPPSSSPPTRQAGPRKFLVDPPKVIKKNVTPAGVHPALETKKKKSKPPSNETVIDEKPTPRVPETSYGKRIWGFVNRQSVNFPENNPEPPVPPSPPPETTKSPKFKLHKESKEPKKPEPQSDLPRKNKSKIKTAIDSPNESYTSKSKVRTAVYSLTEFNKSKSKSKTAVDSYYETPSSSAGASSDRHGNFAKRFLRKQVWAVSKPYIKRNARLSQLLEDSKVNIDKIKINALGLDVINVDALGIKNKALKKGVIWLLK